MVTTLLLLCGLIVLAKQESDAAPLIGLLTISTLSYLVGAAIHYDLIGASYTRLWITSTGVLFVTVSGVIVFLFNVSPTSF